MADEPKSGTSIKILSFRSTGEPRIQEFLAVYDTRLFANRVEENRGYPPRGGVAKASWIRIWRDARVLYRFESGTWWHIGQNGALLLVLCRFTKRLRRITKGRKEIWDKKRGSLIKESYASRRILEVSPIVQWPEGREEILWVWACVRFKTGKN